MVQDINEQLQKYEDSKHIWVVNVKYNPQNNCIVFVRADQQATELIPFANRFMELIAGDRATRVRADRPWYKIQRKSTKNSRTTTQTMRKWKSYSSRDGCDTHQT
ncbi:hypothetical protein AcW2_010268 [Taiwanofungus camphoratus]|nr:hypothetical protein AcW2_010268 [Antrodia cinnamomea]